MSKKNISNAQVVLRGPKLAATVEFFRDRLGFLVTTIFPADNPRMAELWGYGINLLLQLDDQPDSTVLRLTCKDPENTGNGQLKLTAPNGTAIELIAEFGEPDLPALHSEFVLSRLKAEDNWISGRAGMQYRDLIPGRLGGRFIASHIRIPGGGPVPDYVHYHKIYFQMIYCYKGWVKVVYQDQGQPFILQPGDCVIQPPQIRHRVLESSPGLEVIEVGCPAEHFTLVDHNMALPNAEIDPQHDFSGQQFVRHQAPLADWQRWRFDNFEARDIGIGLATSGLAGARVIRPLTDKGSSSMLHSADLMFWFILQGELVLLTDTRDHHSMHPGDSVAIPGGMTYLIERCSSDLEFLQVTLPELT